MRLLDAETLEFEFFNESDLPPYAILSHTWGPDEVTFEELRRAQKARTRSLTRWLQKIRAKSDERRPSSTFLDIRLRGEIETSRGYTKIVKTAEIARQLGYRYFWIDTVCIDKSSSAELQEAINSMYRWYQKSSTCLIYLEDARPVPAEDRTYHYIEDVVSNSRWVTRGWTLQELIAPRFASLYDADWNLVCEKDEAFEPLSRATGVPTDVLSSGEFDQYCVAQRMSWAAHRSTTRIEDLAYCLMGLFDINMPMLYGEGEGAFIRLQEEIIQKIADDSLLAWHGLEDDSVIYRGLLARSPKEFVGASEITKRKASAMSSTGLGIGLYVEIQPYGGDEDLFIALLQTISQGRRIGLLLRKLERDEQQYARVSSHAFLLRPQETDGERTAIFVRQKLTIPPDFVASGVHSFRLQFHPISRQSHHLLVHHVWPPQSWDVVSQEIIIPRGSSEFKAFIWLTHAEPEWSPALKTLYSGQLDTTKCSCQGLWMLLSFDRIEQSGGCGIIQAPVASDQKISMEEWRPIVDKQFQNLARTTAHTCSFPPCSKHEEDSLSVSMKTVLRNDKISLLLDTRVLAKKETSSSCETSTLSADNV